jgi:enediyne biosynthesis protein E4
MPQEQTGNLRNLAAHKSTAHYCKRTLLAFAAIRSNLIMLIWAIWAVWVVLPATSFAANAAQQAATATSDLPNQSQLTDNNTSADKLKDARQALDKTIWKGEVEAQKHEQVFVQLWDQLRQFPDRFATLRSFKFDQLFVGELARSESLDHNIKLKHFAPPTNKFTRDAFHQALQNFKDAGYRIAQTEWHHSRFEPATKTTPAKSVVSFAIDTINDKLNERTSITGKLAIQWQQKTGNHAPVAATIKALDVRVQSRIGEPAFKQVLTANTSRFAPRLMPLFIRDLNGDGLPEIISGGLNRMFHNKGKGQFDLAKFVEPGMDIFDAAVLGDFTGDGHVDLIAVGRDRQPSLFIGEAGGRFTTKGTQCAIAPMELPKAFAAGDIDGDGDLDLYIAQYKFPYTDGAMPTPFYDANDGYPAYLLINNGKGRFTESTVERGLGSKRHRRTYSASFVDLDNDGDLDLLTNNDFSGVDVYHNDGKGHFKDVTKTAIDQRHMFGMSHTIGDLNGDGLFDIYAIGMSSTTANRLEQMGLSPKQGQHLTQMRPAMGYGNRLYLNQGQGRFKQAPFNKDVARTGWAWGTTNFDFDNDGDSDLYVANGHTSGKSCKDYCTQYWRHDLYTGSSKPNIEANKLFKFVQRDLDYNLISWNGFEHNKLLMNIDNKRFENIAHVMGVAFEYDGRSVIGADIDNDGATDLIVTQFTNQGTKGNLFTLHVYRNMLKSKNNWIGVRLQARKDSPSPLGAIVTVKAGGSTYTKPIITGDSFSSQHPPTIHFGLGKQTKVTSIKIRWPNHKTITIDNPKPNQYHTPPQPPTK